MRSHERRLRRPGVQGGQHCPQCRHELLCIVCEYRHQTGLDLTKLSTEEIKQMNHLIDKMEGSQGEDGSGAR
jgi:hypothetical protein